VSCSFCFTHCNRARVACWMDRRAALVVSKRIRNAFSWNVISASKMLQQWHLLLHTRLQTSCYLTSQNIATRFKIMMILMRKQLSRSSNLAERTCFMVIEIVVKRSVKKAYCETDIYRSIGRFHLLILVKEHNTVFRRLVLLPFSAKNM
jgi:hypothetical protein